MNNKEYLNLPFDKYDPASLEALPDEVFFAQRFKVSDEDQKIIDKYTYDVDGKKYYKYKVVLPIYRKYAAMTNPKPGEPGTVSNPLVRFGRRYVYNREGYLSVLKNKQKETDSFERFTITASMRPTKEQAETVKMLEGKPITPDPDCPESTPEDIQRFLEYGRLRNERRKLKLDKTLAN